MYKYAYYIKNTNVYFDIYKYIHFHSYTFYMIFRQYKFFNFTQSTTEQHVNIQIDTHIPCSIHTMYYCISFSYRPHKKTATRNIMILMVKM